VVDSEYTLNVSNLDLNGASLCHSTNPPNPLHCQSGKIKTGDVLTIPFGAHLNFQLVDSNENVIPAIYQLASSFAPSSAPEADSLYPDRLALLFEQDTLKSSQSFITVHMGKQQLKITPLDAQGASKEPITVSLRAVAPVSIGSTNTTYDALIISRAHKIGLPPQYIKGQVAHESTDRLDPNAYRYEPVTNDMQLIQPELIVQNGVLRFIKTKNHNRYGNQLFRQSDRLPNNNELINKRSLYRVLFNRLFEKIPLNYETTIRPNRYTPLYIADIASANTTQNWSGADSAFINRTRAYK